MSPTNIDSTVLVVDDDPSSLRLTEQLLLAAGYTDVHLYNHPRDALDTLQTLQVDLIITDLHMPEVDGNEFLQEVRRGVPEDTFLPVLMVTADASADARRKALVLGADDFLSKPIDVVEMTLRVRHLLQLRSLHLQLAGVRLQLEEQVKERTRELETALAQTENLVKAKDIFIASVGHELRTPLTAVLGFASELASNAGRLTPEEFGDAAGLIASQAADLAAIIDDLLVAARADINAVEVLAEPVDLGKELNAVVYALAEEDRARIDLPEADVKVVGDHLRVRQILRNLINNAIRHGGPRITVELEASPGWGTVTVIDDGQRISEQVRAKLFEPYFHGQPANGPTPAIGLGLPVSRFLAGLMQGELAHLADHPGTAFRLSLPAA